MKVELLNGGWFTVAAGIMRKGEPFDQPFRHPIPAYMLESGEHRILVDTGLNPGAVVDSAAHYDGAESMTIFTLEQERSVAQQVDMDTVTMVVMTHLHFDHAGGLSSVPASVPVVMQRREWEAGQDATEVAANAFHPRDYTDVEHPLVLVDGDHDLLGDGSIELLFTPGHTPGHQSVRVGNLVIGGDVGHFTESLDDHRFPIFGHDLEEQGRSADRLRALRDQGLRILPGHDPEVLLPGPVSVDQPEGERR